MSGIAGIFYRNNQVIEPNILKNMVSTLSHRGRDGSGTWHHKSIGLAHLHWAVTPEAEYEQQPLEVEHIVITADVRIDNREELLPQLSFPFVNTPVITDVDIIAAAYLKWGEECLSYLLGAFVFAIWDKKIQKLFVANDHLGLKTIYYYQNDNLFAFASEIKTFWSIPSLNKILNPRKVVTYAVGLVGKDLIDYPDPIQHYETIFQDIYILSQSTRVVISKSSLTFLKYWDIDKAAQKIKYNTKEEYQKAFKERFSQAVNCRLRSNKVIGADLSGGLDSSSITSMACHLSSSTTKFQTYHTFTEQTDERHYAEAVLNQYSSQLNHHVISPKSNFDSVKYYGKLTSEPLVGIHYGVMGAVHEQMKNNGIGVSLSGEGGDDGISYGNYFPMDVLVQNGYDAYRTVLLKAHNNPQTKRKISQILSYYNDYMLVPYIFKAKWGMKVNLTLKALRDADFRLLKSMLRRGYYLYRPAFFRHPRNKSFFNKKHTHPIVSKITGPFNVPYFGSEYEVHLDNLNSIFALRYHAESTTIAHHLNIDFRFPFRDKELLTLCLAVPPSLKWCEGYGRGILRKSLKGIVPDKVLNRVDKSEFSKYLLKAYHKDDKKKLTDFILNITNHEDFINTDSLNKELLYLNDTSSIESRGIFSSFRRLHRLLYFYIWKKSIT